ncbi:MAG: dolichyl-phosphate-mannose--protein mannosyltransferase [Archangiaceae bacterium]|nr:dolichyl-phosphate-mannose--protein mannosyltransferase [Archangiaceae bacterium]
MSTDAVKEPDTLTEALLGKELLNLPLLAKFKAWPVEYRTTLVAALMASLVLLPYLGAVGLWDPWETHYGEVAREMVQRNDYVHPYWENAWFFSKPAFTMWMMALGLQAANGGPIVGVLVGGALLALGLALFLGKVNGKSQLKEFWGSVFALPGSFVLLLGVWGLVATSPWKFAGVAGGDGAMPLFTEWGFRLPFAGFSIVAVSLLTYAMTRTVSARAALATAVVLVTMPLYFLISRQAVTDTPFVSALIAGMACTMVGLLDRESKYRSEFWYAAYAFFAIATLAKGLLGFGLPMVTMGLLAAIWLGWAPSDTPEHFSLKAHVDWAVKYAARPVGMAAGVGLVVGFIAMSIGDSQRTVFMAVPIRENNTAMLSAPQWLGIMWGSLAFWAAATVLLGLELKKITERPPALFALMWEMRLGTGLLLFLAIALPWYYRMFTFGSVDDEGKLFWFRFIIHDHFARLGSGVHTTTPGGDFTYFILQGGYASFPWVLLIPGAFATVGRLKLRYATAADLTGLVGVLWFAVAWGLIGASATKFHHYVIPMLPPIAILIGMFIDRVWEEGIEQHAMVILLGVPFAILVGKDLATTPKNFTDLFVYNYDRPYPQMIMDAPAFGSTPLKTTMGYAFAFAGLIAGLFAYWRSKVSMFTTGLATALVFALWFNWGHWVDLSHHWTQRDQFWRYYTNRRPGEPIAAFLMNWRGETFYSRNQVKQIKDNANVGMCNYAAQPGREWALVEHARLGILKGAVGPDKNVTLIDKDLNNKFVLVTIE